MKTIQLNQQTITPSKIICIGRNYVEHIQELANEIPDEMVVFLKPNSAISEQLYSFHQEPIHYEGELCFLYNKGRFSALGFGLDLTKRQLQAKLKSKGLPWERAKAFDGSAVFSAFIELDEISEELNFELSINQKIIQQGHINLMMYKPNAILAELKTFMSLNDGDIVMTGTPKGVGIINKNDVFEVNLKKSDKILLKASWLAQ